MATANTFSIKEEAGVTTQNYPIQIGRMFIAGEITNYPQIVISGSGITTQADVKSRWSDSSVKHAILTFYVPTLSANNTVFCSFQNQISGNNSGYATKTQMLSAGYNFDAWMVLTSGTDVSASARSMVNADKFSYWTSGSISTSIIVADHTSARSYDMGWDPYLSFRPIFHITFWPQIAKVQVRYIGEIANSEKLQNLGYSLRLSTGDTTTSAVYSKSAFLQQALTRWTKKYWIGNQPPEVSFNHNLAYLTESKAVFNWDTTKTISESKMSSEYTSWTGSSRDLFDRGLWSKDQGDPGSRPDIAPIPAWYIRWLYTGDVRMQRISLGQGELACAWPIHLRECNTSKNIQGSTNGLGKVISIRNRPTIITSDLRYEYTVTNDKAIFVSATPSNQTSTSGWNPDMAHMPDTNSVLYLLTGEFWHLEELYFWSSWAAGTPNGAAYDYSYGRGPTGAEGGISDSNQIRGNAWSFRNRVHAAFYSPDSFIEKTYFSTLIDDALAGWEAKFALSGTQYTGNTMYTWALAKYLGVSAVPPMFTWGRGSTEFSQAGYGIEISATYEAISQFEQSFMMVALGRGKELGYPTSAVINHISKHYIGAITDASYNPYLLNFGRIPTTKVSDQHYFSTWAELKTGWQTSIQATSAFTPTDLDGSYSVIALAATAFISGPNSADAWAFMNSKLLSGSTMNDTPTWALVNREATSSSSSSTTIQVAIVSGGYTVNTPTISTVANIQVSVVSGGYALNSPSVGVQSSVQGVRNHKTITILFG